MQCITFINSNFHLNRECILSNVRVRVLVNVDILQCARRFATYTRILFNSPTSSQRRILSSIQLRVNKNFFHQFSFYLSNFVHQCRGLLAGGLWAGGLLACYHVCNRPRLRSKRSSATKTPCMQTCVCVCVCVWRCVCVCVCV